MMFSCYRMKERHTLPSSTNLPVIRSDLNSLSYDVLSDALPNFLGFELVIIRGEKWTQPDSQVHFMPTYLSILSLISIPPTYQPK